jgi:hypothetical protein
MIVHLFGTQYGIIEIKNRRMLWRLCVIQRQVTILDIRDKATEISALRRGVDVVFALLGRNATYVGVWLSTLRDDLSAPPSRVTNSMQFRQFYP